MKLAFILDTGEHFFNWISYSILPMSDKNSCIKMMKYVGFTLNNGSTLITVQIS
jgi:hypothetical protein